jgi:hypothetical protein
MSALGPSTPAKAANSGRERVILAIGGGGIETITACSIACHRPRPPRYGKLTARA